MRPTNVHGDVHGETSMRSRSQFNSPATLPVQAPETPPPRAYIDIDLAADSSWLPNPLTISLLEGPFVPDDDLAMMAPLDIPAPAPADPGPSTSSPDPAPGPSSAGPSTAHNDHHPLLNRENEEDRAYYLENPEDLPGVLNTIERNQRMWQTNILELGPEDYGAEYYGAEDYRAEDFRAEDYRAEDYGQEDLYGAEDCGEDSGDENQLHDQGQISKLGLANSTKFSGVDLVHDDESVGARLLNYSNEFEQLQDVKTSQQLDTKRNSSKSDNTQPEYVVCEILYSHFGMAAVSCVTMILVKASL
ncbi:hypothetical protein KC19_3G152300 [Ceratodon purpureus]|uniref:Uncharacterized protein n=1 Tax=Ceratodon purpureus TaxID=3225 RepID=A0A8T0IMH9_CERPU|nr:hypothetical protein KC19_3G152300 [Ceratodon purpureus]